MSQANTNNIENFISGFERFEKSLNGEASTPLHAVRKQAIEQFRQSGFPTTRDEEWRFTNVTPIARTPFVPALRKTSIDLQASDIAPFVFGEMNCVRLAFVNGQFAGGLSQIPHLPTGVTITSLAKEIKAGNSLVNEHLGKYVGFGENAFTALNTAFVLDGAFIRIAKNLSFDTPVHLLFISTEEKDPVAIHPRNLILVERSSRVSIVESYVSLSLASNLTNAVTEFVVGENAAIEHDKLQDESPNSFHIGTILFKQASNSVVTSNAINLGGSIVRNDITARHDGQGIDTTLNGLSVGIGTQLIDNHTTIDHATPNCGSHELYKCILDGKSRGVFNGKIFVRKDAQKTDAKQTNKTLLLSDEATMDTKPQLEIFADDVKCTHGATVGFLDAQQLFYLRSRGIGYDLAKDILTFAFAADIINRVHIEPLREQLDAMLHQRLQAGRAMEE